VQRTGRCCLGVVRGARFICSVLGLSISGMLLLFASPALAETAGISGKVSNALTHQPIEGIEACAFSTTASSVEEEEAPGIFGCATTGSGREYAISGLNAGSYDVVFEAPFKSVLNYVPQFYEGKLAFTEATAVTLTAGAVKSGVNAELEPGAEISGVVTEAATGASLEGILVCALGPQGGGSGAGVARTVVVSRPVAVSLQPGASVRVRLSLNLVGRHLLRADGDLPDAHLDFTAPATSGRVRVQARSVIVERQKGHRG
jgi:hypothetical protein